jgi:hypothetical protein
MLCSRCGYDIPRGAQFCGKCGMTVALMSSGATPAPGHGAAVAKRIAAWAIVPLIALGIWWIATSPNSSALKLRQMVKKQHTDTISNPELSVNATGYSYFKLDIPSHATSVHFDGTFTASGGSGNDVEAYVLSEQDFLNWQNGHDSRSLYNSGKVTTATISVDLPDDAGVYYLVFNNRFSLFSPKTVNVNGTLKYYQ